MSASPEVTEPINQARWRNRIRATGTVKALQVQQTETGPSLGCEIGDEAGSLLLVFPGRRRIPGSNWARACSSRGWSAAGGAVWRS